eukprot:GILK01005174.1.p2 GENE.GILK01005174.1~~GILK01005174.1.p2  ORF type:complete len:148 (+),score=10.78 GILK01005174.1:42-485(+)
MATEWHVVKGGCYCKQVKFEITGAPVLAANCHCGLCRRMSGVPFASLVIVNESQIRFTQQHNMKTFSLDKPQKHHHFCGVCGTFISNHLYPKGVMVIPLGILDEADLARSPAYKPTCHIFSDYKADWYAWPDDNLPRHKEFVDSPTQ